MKEQTHILEKPVIELTTLKLVLFTVIFTALSVALPWVAHQFHLAGPIFLPMHFFVLVAALLFGWRVGLMVGILTPLVSFSVSGMPLLAVLPQITLEIAAYGFLAGYLREKLNWDIWLSLVMAMILGRVVLFFAAWILMSSGPITYLVNAVKLGIPGIAIQLALLPFVVKALKRFLNK